MSRFFVGQRVKLARPKDPANLGLEGVFERYEDNPIGSIVCDGILTRDCDCLVTLDIEPGLLGCQREEQLEPILPDGHRPCDEEFKRDLDKLLEGVPA